MNQKKVWNKIAPSWAEYRNVSPDFVTKFLKDKRGKILDLGCGSGRNFQKKKNTLFYGVDFSKEMIDIAKEFSKKEKISSELKVSPANKIPYKKDFFDSAIYVAALHCLKSPKKREKSLKELYRVLKPNSKALVSVWSSTQKTINGKKGDVIIPWKKNGKILKRYYYIYNLKEFETLLKKVGFKVIKIYEKDNIIAIVQKSS